MEKMKKILLISDDIRIPSGVGSMALRLVSHLKRKYEFCHIGAAIQHKDSETVIWNGVKIFPTNGFGNPMFLRQIIQMEKPDLIWLFTDPRFFTWVWQIEDEIRNKIPILYYHVWDNMPIPLYNEPWYKSCDFISCISSLSHEIVKSMGVPCNLNLHGIDKNEYNVMSDEDREYNRKQLLKKEYKDDIFVVLWSSRNIKRKCPSNIMEGFHYFHQKNPNSILILHTDPIDNDGTDLFRVHRDLFNDDKILFSVGKHPTNYLNVLYNCADVTVNLSCLPPGSKIIEKSGYKNIEDIKKGDVVLTHKGRFRKVLKTFSNYNKNDLMVKIKPYNFGEINLTKDHPVLSINRKKLLGKLLNETNDFDESLIKWTNAKDIEKGDLVFFPKMNSEEIRYNNIIFNLNDYCTYNNKKIENERLFYFKDNKINQFIKLDNDLAYFMGRWIGDGSGSSISFNAKYGTDEILKLAKIAHEKFGCDYHIDDIASGKCKILSFCNFSQTIFINFMDKLCRDENKNKKIPDEILYNRELSILDSCINGIYDSDGTRYTNKKNLKKITNSSNILITQLQLALIRLEKKIRISDNYSGYTKKISGKCILYNQENICRTGKNDNGSSRTWFKNNYYVLSVKDVEEYDYSGEVFNLEVDEDNSYTTDSFTVHNSNEGFGLTTCESLMCGTPIIAGLTGGLKDQLVGLDNIPTGIGIAPSSSNLAGSPPTPYIYEDFYNINDYVNALQFMYDMPKDEMKKLRTHCRLTAESKFDLSNMINGIDEGIQWCFNNFEPRKRWTVKRV